MNGASERDEWNPTFPWERATRWLRTTETGRFVVFNVLVFGLVGVAFALQPIANAVGGGREATRTVVTTGPAPPETIALAFGSALAFAPILAVISGVLAGLFLRPSTREKATTAAVGVGAGAGTLLVLFLGTSFLLGLRFEYALIGTLSPLLSTGGAIIVGAGTAALTNVFLPTRPAG